MSGHKKHTDAVEGGKAEWDEKTNSNYFSTCSHTLRYVSNPFQNYEFTKEEIKVLEECDRESFYYRCLPLSILFTGATFAGIKNGYLKPNRRFGAIPKVTLAVILGNLIGLLSYQHVCAEKLMALPGSYAGQVLRDARDGKTHNNFTSVYDSVRFTVTKIAPCDMPGLNSSAVPLSKGSDKN